MAKIVNKVKIRDYRVKKYFFLLIHRTKYTKMNKIKSLYKTKLLCFILKIV